MFCFSMISIFKIWFLVWFFSTILMAQYILYFKRSVKYIKSIDKKVSPLEDMVDVERD